MRDLQCADGPPDDHQGVVHPLLQFGVGFTDVVKRPSRNAAEVRPEDFRYWAPRLLARLKIHRPHVACFHGLMRYRGFTRYGLKDERTDWTLGPQPLTRGRTRIFVVPNPSPANAHFKLADQIQWYDRLADFLRDAWRAAGATLGSP